MKLLLIIALIQSINFTAGLNGTQKIKWVNLFDFVNSNESVFELFFGNKSWNVLSYYELGPRSRLTNFSIYDFKVHFSNREDEPDIISFNSLTFTEEEKPKVGLAQVFTERIQELHLEYNNLRTLKKYCFRGLESLKELWLNDNELESIEEGAFYGMARLKLLYLHRNNITMVDKLRFEGLVSLTDLYISANYNISLANFSFSGLANLKHLDITIAYLKTIENMNISGLSALKKLSFEENKLTDLKNVNFYGLSHLETLKLGFNRIESLNGATFYGLDQLKYLYLDNNKIMNIDNATFHGLNANLFLLDLSSNPLNLSMEFRINGVEFLSRLELRSLNSKESSFASTIYYGLSNLNTLVLSENNLSWHQVFSFQGLDKLKVLDLSNSRINTLNRLEFIGLHNLARLNLNKNYIKNLEGIWLEGLSSLAELSLRENSIESVHNFTLGGLRNGLKVLYLSSNHISALKNYHFFSNISYVNLENNSLDMIRFNDEPSQFKTKIIFSYKVTKLAFVKYKHAKTYRTYLLLYFPLHTIEIDKLLNHSYVFFRKEMHFYSKIVKFYQSVPVKLNDSVPISCSLLFALYRRCKFLRLFVGDRSDYELLIQECSSHEVLTDQLNSTFYS